ncbi:MAG: hypothetical protein HXK63_07305, partial [Campylobacter sp.]|nr:hypothetical protein [Campylobacter sp.]
NLARVFAPSYRKPSFGAQACGAQRVFKFQNESINFKIPRRRNSAPKLNFKIWREDEKAARTC